MTDLSKAANLNYAIVMSTDQVVRSQIKAENSEKYMVPNKMRQYAEQFRIRKHISLSSQKSAMDN